MENNKASTLNLEIQNCFTWLVGTLAQGNTYRNWSDAFARSEAAEAFEKFYAELTKHIDFHALTRSDLFALRFRQWDEESEVMLVPLYMVPLIPDDMTVYSIGGSAMSAAEAKKDLDIRFGCVAWGIKPDQSVNGV